MLMKLFERASREERFWRWFQAQSDRLFNFEADQDRVFKELAAALHKVEKGLTFELGPVRGSSREFIVSADGIRERFPAVRRLAAAAPSMPQWIVIPFRPPKDIEQIVRFGDVQLGPDDLWFTSEQSDGRIGLTLFVRGLTEENHRTLGGAAFILLDNALGEYVVETAIGFIEWRPLPGDPPGAGLTPFRRLRDVFDTAAH
jgi:hypothetical protein